MGFSLGSHVITRYLGEEKEKAVLKGAFIIHPAVKMKVIVENLKVATFGLYNVFLSNAMRKRYGPFVKYLQEPFYKEYGIDFEKELMNCKTLTDYEDKVTTRIFGFNTFDDYLENTSCIN